MYYVYVIKSLQNNRLYIGYTEDLKSRLNQHNAGKNKSTKFSKWALVYYEAYKSKKDATKREKRLKRDGRAKYHLKNRIKNSIEKVV